MNGKLLLQLAWIFERDASALQDDPDDKLLAKDGYTEHTRRDLYRPLTAPERREFDRLRISAARLFYRATASGFVANGTDYAFGDAVDSE
jgi:hypothetical protein